MTTLLLICSIFFLASFIQGITGFGSALVAMPLLAMVINIKEAVPLCTVVSLVITTYMAIQLRHHFDRKKILPLCLGSLPGVFLGATLLKTVPSGIIETLLGVLLLSYALYNLLFSPRHYQLQYKWGYVAGFLSGAIGSAFSAGGPPSIIYATLSNWTKNEIKGTLTGFFCFSSYFVATTHLVIGMTTMAILKYFLFASPFVLLGTAAGSYCYRFVPKETYIKVVYIFLIIMSILMIV